MLTLTATEVATAVRELPALRPVVVQLIQSFDQPDIDPHTVVDEIAQDQALAARILRLANSPLYGLSTHVGSLKDAVMVLGFRTVRAAAVAISLMHCFHGRNEEGFDAVAFWKHCAAVAMAAREIAAIRHQPTDVAFTAGVIHDIGLLALLTLYPKQVMAVVDTCRHDGGLLHAREQEALGIDHSIAGAALARYWNLPDSLSGAILHHEQPEAAAADSFADVLNVANAIAHSYGLPEIPGIEAPLLSDTAMHRLGIGSPELRRVLDRLKSDLESTFQALFH